MDNKINGQKLWVKEGFIGQRMIVLPPNIKRKIIINPLIKNFYLTAIGHYPNAANHGRERKTGSNEFILIYCVEGSGKIHLNNTTHNLIPNTYYIIPKYAPHSYNSDGDNPWSIYWVHFTGDISDKVYDRYLQDGVPMIQQIPYDENRIKLFEQIYSILEHSFNEKEMEVMNFSLLHFISSLIYYKEANPAIYSTDSISNSILFMKKNIHKNLTIDELSKQQNLSVSHYSRSFKNKTGSSPINYFNQLKIQKSCQHLYFSDRNIKEICTELGFEDQFYFSRLFRLIMGVSPSKYKKSHKK